jgi:hypothetical protein
MSLAKYDFSTFRKGGRKGGWLGVMDDWIANLTIDSKETGVGPLVPYRSQRLFLQELSKGMDEGIRSFTVLKARQLGISTIMLPIDLLWLNAYAGTQGAIVVDEEGNREQFRKILDRTMMSLPRGLFAGVKRHNREALELKNGSVIRYLVAGTRKKGALGVGGGYSFVHATECSRYGDAEAWASFVAAFAEENPNRLFTFESTARGFNLFKWMWEDAISEPDQRAIFIGWWAKESYRLARSSKLYAHNFDGTYTDEEVEKIALVKEQYGVEITDEQVAWYRHKTRQLNSEGGYIAQEHPWDAREAFMASGKLFFPTKQLTLAMHRVARSASSPGIPWKGYRYHTGKNFDETKIEQIMEPRFKRLITLRIWEDPDPFGVYAIGVDPAEGTSVEDNTWKDLFCISVWRCYADRLVQVAEYADFDIAPHQCAWILAHLAGAYKNVRVCLEIAGGGTAVIRALTQLKESIMAMDEKERATNPDIANLFDSWAWYLYRRVDSLGGNMMLHFKTDNEKKRQILMRMKDAFMIEQLVVNSMNLLEQMQEVVSKDGWVGAEGRGKDDHVLGAAFAHHCWDAMVRKDLVASGRTYAFEQQAALERAKTEHRETTMISYVIRDFFKQADERRANSTNGTVDDPATLYG